jgi:hypothetical protein
VQVLRARQVGEEREHEQQVQPDERALGPLEGRYAHAVGEPREPVGNGAMRIGEPERDPGRLPEQQRDHDGRDHQQDAVGFLEV